MFSHLYHLRQYASPNLLLFKPGMALLGSTTIVSFKLYFRPLFSPFNLLKLQYIEAVSRRMQQPHQERWNALNTK